MLRPSLVAAATVVLCAGCGSTGANIASTTTATPGLAAARAGSDTPSARAGGTRVAGTGSASAPVGGAPGVGTAVAPGTGAPVASTAARPGSAAAQASQVVAPKPPASPTSVPKPPIVWNPIPFGPRRKAEMAAYVRRHYGSFMAPTYRLTEPHVIVIHYTETPDFQSTFNTFAPDTPDPELHELPNTCAHFVIDRAGIVHQLVPLAVMCRHTVGLNWTAVGVEHVGYSDSEVLGDSAQMRASLSLVRWLRCRYRIPVGDVIGHAESLSSTYHREDVPSLRTQTHSDFVRADMQAYRRRLRALGGCPS